MNNRANLNTILLMIVLGVVSWVGYTTQQTAVAVAVIREKTETQASELLNLRSRVGTMELQIAGIRRE